jgi:hypothetical protein
MSNPYEGLQSFVDQLPELVQPLIIAGLGAVPYIEGEGSAAIGIIAGINPIVAGVAGAIGNILAVLGVVLLSSRVRESVVARRSRAAGVTTEVLDREESTGSTASGEAPEAKPGRRAKGQQRLRRWLVKFGVPGASLLAPLALPTTLTAAFFVGSGVSKGWVLVWQVVAILLWTGLVTAAATGVVSVLGW